MNSFDKKLSTRQHRLLLALAEGAPVKVAARTAGVPLSSAYRIANSPRLVTELQRLREEAERELLERLPDLIERLHFQLATDLMSRDWRARAAAAATLVRLIDSTAARSAASQALRAALADIPATSVTVAPGTSPDGGESGLRD